MATNTLEVRASLMDDRISILDRNKAEGSPLKRIFGTVSSILAHVRDKTIADDDLVQLSNYSFNVCEALEVTIQEKKPGILSESVRTALNKLGIVVSKIERAIRKGTNTQRNGYNKGEVEGHKREIQQIFDALNVPSSFLNKDNSEDGCASESLPLNSCETAATSVSENAFRRLYRREFISDELVSLIELSFAYKDVEDSICRLPKDDAQTFVDVMDEALDMPNLSLSTRVKCLRRLYRACGTHGILPKPLEIPVRFDNTIHPLYRGGYADVWKGEHCGRDVAVKVIRTYSRKSLKKIIGRFCKEVITWRSLQHQNVLPLVGVMMSEDQLAMVSDWMVNGNINEFVEENPDVNRLELLGDVARGLIYIHQRGMIHGDLKGANILIDQTGHACLADFGLLTVASDPTTLLPQSSYAHGGTMRWMGPELIAPEEFGLKTGHSTKSSDCYSFGMVIYETISGNVPFHEVSDVAVFLKVVKGERPCCKVGFPEDLQKMMEQCWESQPNKRPSVEEVLECLEVCSTDGISWQQLLGVKLDSNEFLKLTKTLLSSEKHSKFNVSQFSPKDALQLVDVIDIGILQKETFPNNLKSVAFGILRELSGRFRRLPKSCLIEEGLSKEGDMPFSTRGFTTLWKGQWNGDRVVIKTLRLGPDDDLNKIESRFCREVLLWPRLHHANVLPVYGFSLSTIPLCVVSPWMENGNILEYTRKHPEVNRMSLLVDVAYGLRYLHKIGQVHGNIRGANVLISNDKQPRARLADFGLNAIMFDVFSMSRTSINWTAPEILTPEVHDFKPTFASDIYALGMLVYEVLTGRRPFCKLHKMEVVHQVVVDDKRPLRPQDSERLGITDSVWGMMITCWDKKDSARHQIENVIACLTRAAREWAADIPAFLLASEAGIAQVMDLKGEDAEEFVDKLYKTLASTEINSPPGKTYLSRLKGLCETSGALPAPLMLPGEFGEFRSRPTSSSGSANIYKTTYKGHTVAVKVLKGGSSSHKHKWLVKEVIGWACLRHEYILPFIGISVQPTRFSIVSEWMPNGNIVTLMSRRKHLNLFPLLIDAALGLKYLHHNDFVHGNLKGENILVDSNLRARLADFSRLRIIDDDALEDGMKPQTGLEPDDKIGKLGDSVRWNAPEMMDPDRFGFTMSSFSKLPSKSTDIYALGMTILEVLTGRPPFGRASDGSVVKKVLNGVRPEKPNIALSNELWELLQHCWSEEYDNQVSKRPTIATILEPLQKESAAWYSATKFAFPSTDSKRLSSRNIRSNTKLTEDTHGNARSLGDLLADIESSLQ